MDFTYWVGMNTAPDTGALELAEFNRFYSQVHVPEVVAGNSGFVSGMRYELALPDPRGDFGPRWLAAYQLDGEGAAQAYAERNDGPAEGRPQYTPRPPAWQAAQTTWRIIWRRIAASGTSTKPPASIFMVGMNVPVDTDAAGLAEFNQFYTNVHVPEVMARRGYALGIRFELYRAFLHPEPGCPRFCAIYEADEAATEATLEGTPGQGPLSSGPPTWEKHDTLWRLVYRRI